MRSDLLPLSRYAVDRDGAARTDAGLLGRLSDDPATRVVLVHRGRVAVTGSGRRLDLAGPRDVRARDARAADAAERPLLAYLGADVEARYLAAVLPGSDGDERDYARPAAGSGVVHHDGRTWASLREVGADLGDRDAGLAATAVALAAWHERHRRCPQCGTPTEPEQAGWVRRCPLDGSQHYPRSDPAVIVAVTDDADALLLTHATHWPARRFSVVAGFVEPGESLEAAVRREVAEETGLQVGALAYQGSQPWPFPSSLMLAFRARVVGGALQVDGDEVTEARFVTRSGLPDLVARGEVVLPYRSSIARALIEDWLGEPLPGS